MKRNNYYSILGISRNSSKEEIRKAYLTAAQKYHPDKNVSPGETEFFLETQQAYEILSDETKRAEYDSQIAPEIGIKSPIENKIIISRESIKSTSEAQLIYAILEFSTSKTIPNSTTSQILNVCLVIDCSTSMKGVRLDLVKSSVIQIIRNLKADDLVSIITFSDRAETLLSSSNLEDLSRLEARIRKLQTSGGTEIFQGLSKAFTEIKHTAKPGIINHIILLTDGHTYGDEVKCLELADEAITYNIGISCLGIGSEWNDIFLDEIAKRTGGNSYYVSNPGDIHQLLSGIFNQLQVTFCDDVLLEFNNQEIVNLRFAFRLEPELGLLPIISPIHLGPIPFKGSLSVLFEFLVSSTVDFEKVELMTGNATINISNLSQTSTLPINLVLPVSRSGGNNKPPPERIINALSKLTLFRLQDQARLEVKDEKYNQASQHLQLLATHLLQRGERELARTVLLEAENINKNQYISTEGEKRIKYGTRALLLPGNGDNKA